MILYLWGVKSSPTWRKKFVFWDSKEQREEDWVGTIRRDVSSPWRNLLQISVKDKMDLPVGFGNSFPILAEVRWRPAGSRQFNSEVPTSCLKPDSSDLKEWVNLCFASSVHLKFFATYPYIWLLWNLKCYKSKICYLSILISLNPSFNSCLHYIICKRLKTYSC